MKKDYKLYLKDVLESIIQIEKYLAGVSEEQFKKDKKLQDAVIRRIEVIGEASKNIPRALKEKNREVPWFEISQFRDFIVHSYFEINLNRIWTTVTVSLPRIKEELKRVKLV